MSVMDAMADSGRLRERAWKKVFVQMVAEMVLPTAPPMDPAT